MNPWMKRTESSANATMRHGSLPARVLAEAAGCVVPRSVTTVMSLLQFAEPGKERIASHVSSCRVVKADLLQLWHRGGGAGDEDHARDQVVSQFGRERLMRQLVGVHVRFDQRGRLLPDRVVTRHERDAAPHQGGDRIVRRGERTRRILEMRRIHGPSLLILDQRVGLELVAGELRELVLFPYRLVV